MATQPSETVIPRDSLAMRLYIARKQADGSVISQRDAAKAVGVSHATWANWERGVYEPRRSQLQKAALVLGVDYRWLNEGGALLPEPSPPGGRLPRLDSNQKPAVLRRVVPAGLMVTAA